MNSKVDLHTHTTFSDGVLSPSELMAKAKQVGISVISVTDHDTVAGVPDCSKAAAKVGIDFVPGLEISASVEGVEVHILGYFFDPDNTTIREYCDTFRNHRRERAMRIVDKLDELGIALDHDKVIEDSGEGTIGRPHIADAMVNAGYVASISDAFDLYLKDGGPAYVSSRKIEAGDAIKMLSGAGGISVLAHPGQWTSDRTVMSLIRSGIDGVEVVHPSHDQSLQEYYRNIAREFFLVTSGGSDYHGPRKSSRSGRTTETIGRYFIRKTQLEKLDNVASNRVA